MAKNKDILALVCLDSLGRAFTENHLLLLVAIATQITFIIESMEREKQVCKRNEEEMVFKLLTNKVEMATIVEVIAYLSREELAAIEEKFRSLQTQQDEPYL